ncbi:MAG: hypothetical protein AAGG54_07475 [Pseudomonadota bacterium]
MPAKSNSPTTANKPDLGRAKNAGEALAQDVADDVSDLGTTLVDKATDRIEALKDGAADGVSSLTSTLRRASDEMRDGPAHERTLGAMAGAIADFSDQIRDRDITEVAQHIGGFARRNPTAFLGGAALLGFAAVRMAKATRGSSDAAHQEASGVTKNG